jgi:hypothetical protein
MRKLSTCYLIFKSFFDSENEGCVPVADEALLYTPNPHPKKNRVAGFSFLSGLGMFSLGRCGRRRRSVMHLEKNRAQPLKTPAKISYDFSFSE